MKNRLVSDVTALIKNQFVVVQITEGWFEIGKLREAQLICEGPPQRTILLLTKTMFPTNLPYFDKNWTPFLLDPYDEVSLLQYPLHTISVEYVTQLLEQQKNYLELSPKRKLELQAFIELKACLLDEQEILRNL